MNHEVNKKLLEAANDWTVERFQPYVQEYTVKGNYVGEEKKRLGEYISCPFYLGLSDEYIENPQGKTRLMIIGQESRGFGSWDRDNKKESYMPHCSQAWAVEYLNKQLDKDFTGKFGVQYNKSRFWNLFRSLKNDFVLCWNNLDKVYFGKDENYKGTLTYSAEKELSKSYGTDEKSLLEREIEIADPDVLLFVTGPGYALSMETAFGIDGKLSEKLNKENGIRDITEIINIGKQKRAFWTYHPANRQGVDSAKLFLETYKG